MILQNRDGLPAADGVDGAHGFRSGWLGFCGNPHVRTEFTALMYLLFAVGAAVVGLRIAPVACGAMAVLFSGADIYSWLHDR